MHGGMHEKQIGTPNLEFLEKGYSNLDKHIENMKKFGVPVVVAINQFPTDSQEEVEHCRKHCEKLGAPTRSPASSSKAARAGSNSPRRCWTPSTRRRRTSGSSTTRSCR